MIETILDELIKEAQQNPAWKAEQALRCAKRELLEEQKSQKGYWVNPTSLDCHCSECGGQPECESGSSIPLYDYCPYCGAKMAVKWE